MCSSNPVNNGQLPLLVSTTGADYLRSYTTKLRFISICYSLGYSLHRINVSFINYFVSLYAIVCESKWLCFLDFWGVDKSLYLRFLFSDCSLTSVEVRSQASTQRRLIWKSISVVPRRAYTHKLNRGPNSLSFRVWFRELVPSKTFSRLGEVSQKIIIFIFMYV